MTKKIRRKEIEDMNRKLALLLTAILCLSVLSGCGGDAPQNAGTVGDIVFGELETWGNNPNNLLKNSSIAFDENYIYFGNFFERNMYRIAYNGEGVEKIFDDWGSSYNIYDNHLYYICDDDIKKLNLTDFSSESIFYMESPESFERKGFKRTGFGRIKNIFIVNDYLFYETIRGWSGTSEGTTMKVVARNLVDGTEKVIYENQGNEREKWFAADAENIYYMGDYGADKLSFEDLKNLQSPMLEDSPLYLNRSASESRLMLGLNGVCYMDRNDDYLTCDYKTGEEVLLVDEDDYECDYFMNGCSERFAIGSSIVASDWFETGITWVIFKNNDFKTYETLFTCSRNADFGVYNNKFYLLDRNSEGELNNLYIVDEKGEVETFSIKK